MKKVLIMLAIIMVATPAYALTLAEKQQYQKWKEEMDGDGYSKQSFKDKCGYDLPVTMNENLVTPFMEGNASVPGHCDSVRYAMATMCEDALAKEAIASKVKAFNCDYKKGEAEGVFALSPEGVLNFTFDVGTPNIYDKALEYLGKAL